ncbi:MAG: M99 family carboxypeptidase catalytic domain-containing protein, partial [Thiohalorhabdaceae bacterium]
MSRLLRSFGPLLMALALVGLAPSPALAVERPSSEHEVYFGGSNYELNVYRLYGRQDGKTLLIIGGIQGDEPGGFMSADFYSDLTLHKGNLIVVPRANLKSIILGQRGADGDMNRRFHDPEKRKEMDQVVSRL